MPTNYLTEQKNAPNFERLIPLYELQPHSTSKEFEPTEHSYESLHEHIDYEAIHERAWQLILNHARPEKHLRLHEAEDNARTALFEALTQSGHVSRIELQGDIDSVHAQIVERLLNGYDPELPSHELWRRFTELCEELAAHEVLKKIEIGEVPVGLTVNTASDFPVSLGEAANKLGYRHANQKGMLRSTFLERNTSGQYVRVIEQISRSNSDPYETAMAFNDMGIRVKRERELDIDILGTQFIGVAQEAEKGVIGLMRRLDSYSGPNIMYGEAKRVETVQYEDVAKVSREREQRVELFVHRIANAERALDKLERTGQISRSEWRRRYLSEIQDCVRQICIINPEYTEGVLGGGAVKEAYMKAHEQFMSGDVSGAAETAGAVSSMEQSIVICGDEITSTNESNDPNDSNNSMNKMKKDLKNAKKTGNGQWVIVAFHGVSLRVKKQKLVRAMYAQGARAITIKKKDPATEYRKQQLEAARAAVSDAETSARPEQKITKQDIIRDKYGDRAQLKTKVIVGGATEVVVDVRSGYELAA